VLDIADEKEKWRVEKLGVEVVPAKTIMKTLEDKIELARVVVKEAGR
jgi:hypothetical protein